MSPEIDANAPRENEDMTIHKVNFDISLPNDLMIDLWLVQWHTPTPSHFQPVGEPHRTEKARILERLPEFLRESAKSSPANRLAMVVFPEISLPKDQRGAIEELLTASDRPMIVVAGFEHLTWADYEALLAEMSDTPPREARDASRQAGTFVNVAGIWIRDDSGHVSRYLQPKGHPSRGEEAHLHAGQNVFVFTSTDQRSACRINFCVQICSDFCSRKFVADLLRDIDGGIPGHPLDMLILPQHNKGGNASQLAESYDTYFEEDIGGTHTRDGCIILANNAAPQTGKTDEWGFSGLCFRYNRWPVLDLPSTYWMKARTNHQAIILREHGPGIYVLPYKLARSVSTRPGSGQETLFPGDSALFAPINKDDPVIPTPSPIWAEAHWAVNEWQADREAYQGWLESNMAKKPADRREAICATCVTAHRTSFQQWKDHSAKHPGLIRETLYSYLSCCSDAQDWPPGQPEPNEWPDTVAQAARELLRCYSLISLGAQEPLHPNPGRDFHACMGEDVGLFFLWGGGTRHSQAMISEYRSRLSTSSSLITRQVLLVLVNPQGCVTPSDLKRSSQSIEDGRTGIETASLPQHLQHDGCVTRIQTRDPLSVIGNDRLCDEVFSAPDEVNLVHNLKLFLSKELETRD